MHANDSLGMNPETNDPLFQLDVRQWLSSSGIDDPRTHVSEPMEITCFSRTPDRQIQLGSRHQLATFSEPKLHVNLGDNIETFRQKNNDFVGVEPVVHALQASAFDIDQQADIITFRNNLNKITATPFNTRDSWECDCAQIDSSVYLDIRKLDDRPMDSRQQLFTYYGYRFEALCTGLAQEPVDANSEFCSVVRLRVANHRIIVSCEIDCTMEKGSNSPNPLAGYVELKTMKSIESNRELDNMYRHRFLKYWIQSYLAGVRRIALGIRSRDGELLDVKHINTRSIPREMSDHFDRNRTHGKWNPFVCINFLDCVLAFIRRACGQRPGCTIRVRYDADTRMLSGVIVASENEGLAARLGSLLKK